MIDKTKQWIDGEELASYLRVKQSYVYQLVSQKRIAPSKPFGKKLYFDKAEIDQMLEDAKAERLLTDKELEARVSGEGSEKGGHDA